MYFAMLMFLVLTGAVLLQAALPGWALLGYARPPVLLAVVLYYALNHRLWVGILAAFIAGMLLDGMSFVPLGYSALLFCIVALIAGHYQKLVLSDAVITAVFFGAAGSLLTGGVLYFLLSSENLIACSGGTAALKIFWGTVLGAITAPVVFVAMKLIHAALDLQDKEDADVGA